MDLNVIWFVLIAVLIAGYAVLDGFDLGVGVLSLFARSEEERQLHQQAIGPGQVNVAVSDEEIASVARYVAAQGK